MTWKIFLRRLELRNKVVTLATLLFAILSFFWISGPFPVGRASLLVLAVLTADLGISAFRAFRSGETEKIGLIVLSGLFFFSFSSVLTLFLVVWTTWQVLIWGAIGFALAVFPRSDWVKLNDFWRDFLPALCATALWLFTFSILAFPVVWSGDLWWKIPLSSIPTVLFLTAFRTLNREHGNLALVLPILCYVGFAVLSAVGVLPWTFYAAALVGPALSIPFWRGRAHPRNGFQSFLIFVLVSIMAWALGVWVP